MHVITRKRLLEFGERYPHAVTPLDDWYRIMKATRFTGPKEVKAVFASASFLPNNVTVFNIGGNKFRLVVTMRYELGRVFIRHVLMHKDYDERTDAGTL